MTDKEFKELNRQLTEINKDMKSHPEKYEKELDPFVENWRDGHIQIANLIYWPSMILATLFKGAVLTWIVGTILYFLYVSHIEKEAIKRNKKRRGK